MRQIVIRLAAMAVICWPGISPAQNLPAPLDDAAWPPVDPAEAALGQLLFYDPILSGNREVACATCHHPAFGTSDGLSLSLGDGGHGLGPARRVDPGNPPEQRVPRNSPALWNVGAVEYVSMFHDGRIELDASAPGGMRTPLDADMVAGFASMLSAQTMFPVLSPDEMAGHYSENEVAQAVRQGRLTGPGGAWDLIARRVAQVPAYAARFEAVRGLAPGEIGFTDISDAIAAFMTFEFRSDTSPFDARLRQGTLLSPEAEAGLALFYGAAGCSDCHSGPFQTDHGFHAMGVPQIGPGKAARFESHARDEGRFRVTGRAEDLHAFRTPSLRNVALTAPYGHAGSHATLRGFVADHLDPAAGWQSYDRTQAVLPEMPVADWRILDDPAQSAAIAAAVTRPSVALFPEEIDALVAFLAALTDPVARDGRLGVPDTVPSGLPVPQP
ncbi:cytochrome-c peroxidase [Limimaricola hongkongensis]|uniref:Methylamine utilization protein mauG n=1 Tax=Limimaricola hongkongensis DSM 17492 TaxID=1122180 RepID=A0A017HA53_9RHOB|nr:cytochrome c peroxidase [Limimaricola hongkongensis]EYD71261.1 Methylamine utilization protein mauG precursor [Limimaricola hongkongensis DSM 17492]